MATECPEVVGCLGGGIASVSGRNDDIRCATLSLFLLFSVIT